MNKFKFLLPALCALISSGCSYLYYHTTTPRCKVETTIAIYDENGRYTLPGCIEYEEPLGEDMSGTFPGVVDNKFPKEVVLENLSTRVLAYCRGTEAQIGQCMSRMMAANYVPVHEIPKVPASHDVLKRGRYPERRWHEGDVVPRW